MYPFLAARPIFPQIQGCKLVKLALKHFFKPILVLKLWKEGDIPWERENKSTKSNTYHIALQSVGD